MFMFSLKTYSHPSARPPLYLLSICGPAQPLIRKNLETHEKTNREILQKVVLFYFTKPHQDLNRHQHSLQNFCFYSAGYHFISE